MSECKLVEKEEREEFFVKDSGNLSYVPSYGVPSRIKTWYFTIPGQEHVPGRYTLRWRQYAGGDGVLQIKKETYKYKKRCALSMAEDFFSLKKPIDDDEADAILRSIGPAKIIFIISSIREHICEGPVEKVRVTKDTEIQVMSPSGNLVGTIPPRFECKIYGGQSISDICKKYNLVKVEDFINKRIQAFKIVDKIQFDTFKLAEGKEIEIKFISSADYKSTIEMLKMLNFSEIRFIWQSFEHEEENTHIYYTSSRGVFREIIKDGKSLAIIRKTDKQALSREEQLCDALPLDAKYLGGVDRRKFKLYLTDTITGHCFQLAVDESTRHSDRETMIQVEAEYIRSIYPWSTEDDIIPSIQKLNSFLQRNLKGVESTLKRKVDFIVEAK